MLLVCSILSFFTSVQTISSFKQLNDLYCHHPDCSLPNQHTMCLAADKQSPRLYASGMTPWMRFQILLLHNRHRDNIAMGLEAGQPSACNMRKMYWDDELEEMAEIWARQCQKRHDECRNTIRFNVLQNIDVRPVVPKMTEAQLLADAVGSWFSGARQLTPESVMTFKLSNCSGPGGCNAHWYSAAAWASTWRIGCSQSLCTIRRPACSSFRKKRKTDIGPKNETSTCKTERTTVNVIRRKYMESTVGSSFEDFVNSEGGEEKESPLHRGVFEMANKAKKHKERKFMAYTVCNYGPAGNIEGFPIYRTGLHCTGCPGGTKCIDSTHRALCTVINDPDV